MHKPYYTSGFLYSLKTHKILLLQSKQTEETDPLWSMLGGEGNEGEDAPTTFQRLISDLLNIKLKSKDIYPIYDYFHNTLNKINYVFYAEVKDSKKFDLQNKSSFSWVRFEEIAKLLFTTQAKQDVIVGQRVINLKQRVDLNLQ